ncbi:MAG: hypothetical protein LBO79_03790 [Zoogloeaceae bacterium]|jgi:hypothetical protein|nr:hypothetical protein [Zoogloeaceae bacterium]
MELRFARSKAGEGGHGGHFDRKQTPVGNLSLQGDNLAWEGVTPSMLFLAWSRVWIETFKLPEIRNMWRFACRFPVPWFACQQV